MTGDHVPVTTGDHRTGWTWTCACGSRSASRYGDYQACRKAVASHVRHKRRNP